MALQYRVYTNGGSGGPVDYSAPAVTTAALMCDLPPVGPGADLTAVVRAHDTVSGLEDPSTDARVRVRFDGSGDDVTGYPMPPVGLSVAAGPAGTAVAHWSYPVGGGAAGFHLYSGPGTPDYSAPAASVAYDRDDPGRILSATITGLADGVTCAVAVRAFNALGEETNVTTAAVVGRTGGPSPAVPLSASPTP